MKDRWNIPDDEFDGLFRDAADHFKPPFDPEAWRKMQLKLDEQHSPKPTPPAQSWMYGGLAVALLLFFGLALVWTFTDSVALSQAGNRFENSQTTYKNNPVPVNTAANQPASPTAALATSQVAATKTVAEAHNASVGSTANKAPVVAHELKNTTTQPLTGESGTTPLTNTKERSLSEQKLNKPVTDERGITLPTNTTERHFSEQKLNKPVVESALRSKETFEKQESENGEGLENQATESLANKAISKKTTRRTNRITQNTVSIVTNPSRVSRRAKPLSQAIELDRSTSTSPVTTETNGTQTVYLSNEPNLPTLSKSMTENTSLLAYRKVALGATISVPTVKSPAPLAQEPVKPVVSTRPKFGIRLMMAPDVNTVGSSNPFALGKSYGLLFEYQLFNRLFVQTGVIRTGKSYSSSVEDYHNPTGFWTYGVKPANISATCQIVDIPVNLRWDAVRKQKYDLFLNGGLSSYIMLTEQYNYEYAPPYNTNTHLRQSYEEVGKNQHFMSTLNLSLGYERQLRRGFTVQLEPYLKLPLKGVGFAAVDIYSTGLLLSTKYQFGWKK
ncbi:MAG: hypothetical protein U0Y10_22900 [Spirosomataceae bacterium]